MAPEAPREKFSKILAWVTIFSVRNFWGLVTAPKGGMLTSSKINIFFSKKAVNSCRIRSSSKLVSELSCDNYSNFPLHFLKISKNTVSGVLNQPLSH